MDLLKTISDNWILIFLISIIIAHRFFPKTTDKFEEEFSELYKRIKVSLKTKRLLVFKKNKSKNSNKGLKLNDNYIYLICLIIWPVLIAIDVSTKYYLKEILYGDFDQFGKIPTASVALGLISGFIGGVVFFGISYLLNLLLSKLNFSFNHKTSNIFLVITIFFTALYINGTGDDFVRAITLKKEDAKKYRSFVDKIANDPNITEEEVNLLRKKIFNKK